MTYKIEGVTIWSEKKKDLNMDKIYIFTNRNFFINLYIKYWKCIKINISVMHVLKYKGISWP